MSSTVYTITIPTFINGLQTLSHILKKGEEYATEKGIALDTLLNARLYEDMKPLSFQIFATVLNIRKTIARTQLVDPPAPLPEAKTYQDLYTSIDAALAEIQQLTPAGFADKEQTAFKAPLGDHEIEFTPESYALNFGLPNVYFHITTAYAILRAQGVPLGKLDFLKNFLS
ncbi:hypothetical protein BO86DRAFT_384826 [Aspergillus japonicus CBS 114.51]|uniref:DUF1993 domain-containing protein n=2 Tax=Aspergillus TaxID=5052 RepID=A0A2V5IH52_ASPV1|nr:hypothetical protein BO86DRAFT_384826 [Aspergillus japonicus CBS 114.51]PYI19006.1 hypothetical protein BO99DRAFT_403038 [Aspergillus violaceofuscus CBS 115571]RAH86742.1 hypothetical protein BO86DRAFT_384826 [Aspergillus japonicus CBS 114.51]